MKTVLITGFEPFGGEQINPSWEVVSQLDNAILGGCRVVARQLPCVFGESLAVLNSAIDALSPSVVLAVGQAGGRTDITVERVAINVDDARIPDNRGNQPVDVPVIPNGPAAWFSTLPIKAMVSAIREAGIPASVSQTAGTFVCNHVMYGLLHKLSSMADVKGDLFIFPTCLNRQRHTQSAEHGGRYRATSTRNRNYYGVVCRCRYYRGRWSDTLITRCIVLTITRSHTAAGHCPKLFVSAHMLR